MLMPILIINGHSVAGEIDWKNSAGAYNNNALH